MRTKERLIQIVSEYVVYDAEVTAESRFAEDLSIDFYDMCEIMDGVNSEYGLQMSLTDMFGTNLDATVGEFIDNVLLKLGRLR